MTLEQKLRARRAIMGGMRSSISIVIMHKTSTEAAIPMVHELGQSTAAKCRVGEMGMKGGHASFQLFEPDPPAGKAPRQPSGSRPPLAKVSGAPINAGFGPAAVALWTWHIPPPPAVYGVNWTNSSPRRPPPLAATLSGRLRIEWFCR